MEGMQVRHSRECDAVKLKLFHLRIHMPDKVRFFCRTGISASGCCLATVAVSGLGEMSIFPHAAAAKWPNLCVFAFASAV
jgi:hypothetical protein